MTKIKEYNNAIKLRKEGLSYSQILNMIRVSKSTLSMWLKKYPLSKNQLDKLKEKNYIKVERFRKTMQLKKEKRLASYLNIEKRKILPISKRELYLAGLMLYWGEGNKASRNTLSINNTDPNVIRFALYWINKSLNVPKQKIQVFLHLYRDMNIDKETRYWSDQLGMPQVNFCKPYIKQTSIKTIDQKGFGHGTCGVKVHDTILKEKILMALKVVAEEYSKKIHGI